MNQAWVIPAISDEIRVTKGAALCVCRTDDGGQTWRYLRQGLPQQACYDLVYRHALDPNNIGFWNHLRQPFSLRRQRGKLDLS